MLRSIPRSTHRGRARVDRSRPVAHGRRVRGPFDPVPAVAAISLALITVLAGMPAPADAQRGSGHVRPRHDRFSTLHAPSVVEVTLQNGDRQVLRDPQFGAKRSDRGDRRGRGRGSAPPTLEPGPRPGNHPEGAADGPGGFGAPVDPRMPTQHTDGRSRTGGGNPFVDDNPDLERLERIVIVSVDGFDVRVDYEFVDGEVDYNRRVWWDSITGWERPAQQGEMYYFEAADIDSIRLIQF